MSEPERKSLHVEIKDAEKGIVTAAISKFGVKDHDSDLTLSGAFGDQKVLISAYEHGSWMGALPVGRGTISEKDGEAIAELKFFMSTAHGREHFEVIKAMGDLQEWSYGFDVLETGEVSEDMRQSGVVRVLKSLKVHEVSPVLLGAGVGTRTLSVKGGATGTEKDTEKPMAETKTKTKLGELVEKLRGEQELSNGDLGEAMGVSATDVGRIIDGDIKKPSLSRLEKAADLLKTSLSRLRSAAESDGCDYTDEDEMRSRGSAAEEARTFALKAEELFKSADAEARAAIEVKTAAEAKEAVKRDEGFQADAEMEINRFNRNMERYHA